MKVYKINSLFQLESIRCRRFFSPIKLIPVILILGYILFILQFYMKKSDSIMMDYGLLRLCLLWGIVDLFMKFFFQKKQLSFPSFVYVQPISKRIRTRFEAYSSLMDFWNYYMLLILVPIMFSLNEISFSLELMVLSILISYSNCFALRILSKSCSGIFRIAAFLLPIYYIEAIKLLDSGMFQIWIVIGLQVLISLGLIFVSLNIKYYDENKELEVCISQKLHVSSWYSNELLPFIRCKRLRPILIFMILYIIVFLYCNPSCDPSVIRQNALFCFIFSNILLGQYSYGIEANYWHLYDVNPIMVKALFDKKFYFSFFSTILIMIVSFPFFIIRDVSLLYIISVALFVGILFGLILQLNFLFTNRIDIWSSAFMNYQGSRIILIIYQIIPIALIVGLSVFFEKYNYINEESVAFFVIGLISFVSKNKVFDIYYKLYRKNKYRILERFKI